MIEIGGSVHPFKKKGNNFVDVVIVISFKDYVNIVVYLGISTISIVKLYVWRYEVFLFGQLGGYFSLLL